MIFTQISRRVSVSTRGPGAICEAPKIRIRASIAKRADPLLQPKSRNSYLRESFYFRAV